MVGASRMAIIVHIGTERELGSCGVHMAVPVVVPKASVVLRYASLPVSRRANEKHPIRRPRADRPPVVALGPHYIVS